MNKFSLAFAAVFLFAAIAHAEEKPVLAFAAAISPEVAFEVCHKPDAIAAAQCAMAACVKAAGEGADCYITSACGRGFAGSMGLTTGEIHWTETVCGAPDETAVILALKAFCKAQAKYVQQCFLATIWDDRGNPSIKEEMWEAKTLQ
jgi:hypothetical protein